MKNLMASSMLLLALGLPCLSIAASPADYLNCHNELFREASAAFIVKAQDAKDTFYFVTDKTILKKSFDEPLNEDWSVAPSSSENAVLLAHSPIYVIDPLYSRTGKKIYVVAGWSKTFIKGVEKNGSWANTLSDSDVTNDRPAIPFGNTTYDTDVSERAVIEALNAEIRGPRPYSKWSFKAYKVCSDIPGLQDTIKTHENDFEEDESVGAKIKSFLHINH